MKNLKIQVNDKGNRRVGWTINIKAHDLTNAELEKVISYLQSNLKSRQ